VTKEVILRDAIKRKKKVALRKNNFTIPSVSEENNIRKALQTAAGNRGEITRISKALGVAPSTVTRWVAGGDIPPPMEKLLNLYFFDIMPFDIVGEHLLESVLSFTEDQWRVINILAKRQGRTPAKWIASKIREYLAWNEEAKEAREGPKLPFEELKVAEDPTPYKVTRQKHP